MIWLVLRRQRTALLLAGGLIAALVAVLVIGRLAFLTDAPFIAGFCGQLNGLPCPSRAPFLQPDEVPFYWVMTAALLGTPGLVGILTGAGLFGREVDHSTHVLALTQSVGRVRWWLTGLLVCGIPATAAVGLLTLVASWALEPLAQLRTPLETPAFETSGIAPMVYTVLAFTVAATAGLVLRSTLSAVVVAVVVQAAVLLTLIVGDVRFHYLPAETTFTMVDPAADGIQVDVPDATTLRFDILDRHGRPLPETFVIGCSTQTRQGLPGCLVAEGGVEVRASHQPLARFWPFQAIEAALVGALAALALAVGHRGLRRRLH